MGSHVQGNGPCVEPWTTVLSRSLLSHAASRFRRIRRHNSTDSISPAEDRTLSLGEKPGCHTYGQERMDAKQHSPSATRKVLAAEGLGQGCNRTNTITVKDECCVLRGGGGALNSFLATSSKPGEPGKRGDSAGSAQGQRRRSAGRGDLRPQVDAAFPQGPSKVRFNWGWGRDGRIWQLPPRLRTCQMVCSAFNLGSGCRLRLVGRFAWTSNVPKIKAVLLPEPQEYAKWQPKTFAKVIKRHRFTPLWGPGLEVQLELLGGEARHGSGLCCTSQRRPHGRFPTFC